MISNISIISKEGEPSFDIRLSQYVGIHVKSMNAVPVFCDKGINHGILLGVSKKYDNPIGLESLAKALSLLITKWKNHRIHQQERETMKSVLISCEQLISKTNIYDFARTLEGLLCKIIRCERANVTLIDPAVKKFVRRLGEPPHQTVVMYSLRKGLAGAAASARSYIICNDITFDRRFLRDIDDPSGTSTSSILSVPLLTRDDTDSSPIAVIQFIDSKDSEGFSEKDAKFGSKYSYTVARIYESIKMLESVNSLSQVLKRIDSHLTDLVQGMEERVNENEGLKRNLTVFRNMIIPMIRKTAR